MPVVIPPMDQAGPCTKAHAPVAPTSKAPQENAAALSRGSVGRAPLAEMHTVMAFRMRGNGVWRPGAGRGARTWKMRHAVVPLSKPRLLAGGWVRWDAPVAVWLADSLLLLAMATALIGVACAGGPFDVALGPGMSLSYTTTESSVSFTVTHTGGVW